VSEVANLKVSAIDSERMTLRVEQGKGQRDRYAGTLARLEASVRTSSLAVSWPEPDQPDDAPSAQPRRPHRQGSGGHLQARVAAYPAARFATDLLEQGVDIRVIQVLLGHAKLETTALYTRVAVNTVRDIKSPLERLGVNLAGRSSPA
jgi:integrase